MSLFLSDKKRRKLAQKAKTRFKRERDLEILRNRKSGNKKKGTKALEIPKRPQPYPFQREGVQLIQKRDGIVLLADEMGLGKTMQALMYVRRNKDKLPVVIVCPAYMKLKWADQVRMHTDLTPQILHGTNIKKVVTTQLKQKPNCVIINYDILEDWLPVMELLKPGILIVDECHYIGNRDTIRTKAVHKLATSCGEANDRIPHRLFLSGTPLQNYPVELWPTLNILWPKKFPDFMSYAIKYCDPQKRSFGMTYKGATNIDDLHKRLNFYGMIRRLKKDVLKQLPDKSVEVMPVDIPRKEYEAAANDFLKWLMETTGGNIDKVTAAAKALIIVRLGTLLRLAAKLKFAEIKNYIDSFLHETDEKLLVFGLTKDLLYSLYNAYEKDGEKHQAVIITGDVSHADRHEINHHFQNSKKCRLFFGNMQAAGVGIDLTAASQVLFVETDWKPGTHAQALDRAHRIGQENKVFCTWMVAHNTVEEKLCALLQYKEGVMKGVLDGANADLEFNVQDKLIEHLLSEGKVDLNDRERRFAEIKYNEPKKVKDKR